MATRLGGRMKAKWVSEHRCEILQSICLFIELTALQSPLHFHKFQHTAAACRVPLFPHRNDLSMVFSSILYVFLFALSGSFSSIQRHSLPTIIPRADNTVAKILRHWSGNQRVWYFHGPFIFQRETCSP